VGEEPSFPTSGKKGSLHQRVVVKAFDPAAALALEVLE
jgi:hypothetical protein